MKLEIKDLAFAYKNHSVFENVSFSIEEVCFCALVGPNGAGKTTLLKCINGILLALNNVSGIQRVVLNEGCGEF